MKIIRLYSNLKKTNIRNIIAEEIADQNDIYEKTITYQDRSVTIFIYEEYFFRINSMLSVSIILELDDNGSKVELVASGAKIGLMDITYGAENASLQPIVDKLVEVGFIIDEPKE